MPADLAQLRYDVALANRILAHEGVLDAFGHVSVRHPDNPGRYFLSCSRSPELVAPDDIVELDLDSNPVKPTNARLYGERVIHGEIFKARPDVMAVCHHHAPAFMPYVISDAPLEPVYHLGATLGAALPVWDQRAAFGVTNLLVVKPEEGRSLAEALGPHWTVLMRRHGATVAGTTLQELVFRTIYGARNAEYLTQARVLGTISALTAEETERAGTYNLQPGPVSRAWEYWVTRLGKAGDLPEAPKRKKDVKAKEPKASKTKGKTGRTSR